MSDVANSHPDNCGAGQAADPKHQAAEQSPASAPGQAAPAPLARRTFLHATGTVLVSAALTACSAPLPRAASRSGEKVQLVYQDWPTGAFPSLAQHALDEFHASHPNIRVFYVPDPENPQYAEKVQADMEAGTMSDVFQGCCTHFPIWAQKDYLLDLRPYVASDLDKETIADWDSVQYQSFFTRDGKQFGLPKYHGALALYYNRDMFRQAGLDFPNENWTHDDYLAAMKKLTRHVKDQPSVWGSMLEIIWDRVQVHVNGWGGHYVDPSDARRSLMGAPEALAAFQWLRDRIWEDHVMPAPADVQKMGTRESFVAGRVAMIEDGSWALKDVLSQATFDVGVAPFPAGPARRATLTTTDGFGIYRRTKHPDEAWELMKFLISKEYGRQMARAAFLQPARASLVDEWAGFIRAEFPDKAKDVDIAAFAHGHRHGYSVTAEVFANMAKATDITTQAWEKIFTFGEAPVESMIEASRQIEQAQGPG